MTAAKLRREAADVSLTVIGTCETIPEDGLGQGTIHLLGPDEPQFWAVFSTSREYRDGDANPMDRWSTRIISHLADRVGGTPVFPFGQPARPFLSWALRSGSCWSSPVGLLVHRTHGLLVSFRGAIVLEGDTSLAAPQERPCDSCTDKPCLSACPVEALGANGYDLKRCHSFLDTTDGRSCMSKGCAVRLACPVSQTRNRPDAQSAFHMASFHPGG